MQANDMAAMREALEKAKKAICHHAEHVCRSLSWENSDIQSNCADVLCAHRDLCKAKTAINAALAKPPRNCDFGGAEEQVERWQAFCAKYDEDCTGCPCDGDNCASFTSCFSKWAQMPYTEGGAES